MTFWASPSFSASPLFGRDAEAFPLPPRITEPPAGTTTSPPPLAGFSSAVRSVPFTRRDSSVWSARPLLNTVAEIAAGPVDSGSGWVITIAFWISMSPTEVAA